MPKSDGTLTFTERAALSVAQARYEKAVGETARHPGSKHIYEALEKQAFANLLLVSSRIGRG